MTSTDGTARRRAGTVRAALLALMACTMPAGPGAAQAPLSANDWVAGTAPAPRTSSGWRPSDGVPPDAAQRRPPPARPDSRKPALNPDGTPVPTAPVAGNASAAPVTVTRLGQADADAAGLRSARSAGLPAALWDGATAAEVAQAIAGSAPRLPATQDLFDRFLTAQLAVPAREDLPDGSLLLARVDRLLQMGNLPFARALLQSAGADDAGRFARMFDLDMLTGEDLRACGALARRPGLARDMAMRIYCLALNGDWGGAALTLEGAEPLGLVDPATAALLARFLDDSYSDVADTLPAPETVTPLVFHLHEAVGQPLATGPLPLIFAWSDLGPNGGWKARLEAAERLGRAGVLPPAQLAAIYTEQRPAASGGVWDRAAALQALTAAMNAGDIEAVAAAVPPALARFGEAGLAPHLARMVATGLPEAPPDGDGADGIVTLRLLAGLPVDAPEGTLPQLRWLVDVAAGTAHAGPAPNDPQGRAAALAAGVDPALAGAAPQPGSGLPALAAMADVDAGLDGDVDRAARGLRRLSELGYAATARQAAVELMILPQLSRAAE